MHLLLLLTIISKCYLVLTANPLACVLYKDKNCATYKFEPTCGNNGITYTNVCFFSKEECIHPSLFVAHQGPCVPTTTEGPTTHAIETFGCRLYKNRDCTKVAVKQSCGNDGVTYDNACFFGQKECNNPHLQVHHDGPCPTQRPTTHAIETFGCRFYKTRDCTKDAVKQSCGNDGVTYDNACFFGQQECINPQLQVQYEGPCTTQVPSTDEPLGCRAYKNRDCTAEPLRNTCGSDGVTYSNACYFGQAECSNPSLQIKSLGSCPTTMMPTTTSLSTTTLPTTRATTTLPTTRATTTLPTTTETTTLPTTTETTTLPTTTETTLPTTTETTLPTTTETPTTLPTTTETTTLSTTKQTTSKAGSTTIPTTPSTTTTTTLSFLCQAMMNAVCPSILNMQCGNDNRTYQNPCEVTKAQCVQPGLTMSYDGPCVSTTVDCSADVTVVLAVTCPDVQDPFCGSDGNTYENICEFRKAKCFLSTLEIASVGTCT